MKSQTCQSPEGSIKMEERLINVKTMKSVLTKVGIAPEECDQCIEWTSSQLEEPLNGQDQILAELTREEQGFLRCIGYASEEKVVDSLRLMALRETFWKTMRTLHDLPHCDLTVKEGKYIVAM